GPFGIPAALAGAVAAWLAGKLIDFGLAQLCALWKPVQPEAPTITTGASPETTKTTFGDLRAQLNASGETTDFTQENQKKRLEIIESIVVTGVVENPRIAVDADGGKAFVKNAKEILRRLGAEADDIPMSANDLAAAEAIVIVDGTRPSVYVRDGFVDLENPLLKNSGWRKDIAKHEDDIRSLIKASGRVLHHSDRSPDIVFGSAWMLEDGRVATARHVVENMVIESGGQLLLKDRFYVDFGVEADRPVDPSNVFRISGVDWAAPEPTHFRVRIDRMDAAILTLAEHPGRRFPDPVPLMPAGAEIKSGDWFINIGHPGTPTGSWLVDAEDGDDNTITRAVLEALIGDKFGVKRLSPGRVAIVPGVYPGDDATQHVFTHDAATLAGSSGSAIMTPAPAQMLGLHFAGQFGTGNFAHYVPALGNHWPA
ncbi:MAG: trypsin-like peptidase domain-containing protein, partial [Pseudomonadota bacterium]